MKVDAAFIVSVMTFEPALEPLSSMPAILRQSQESFKSVHQYTSSSAQSSILELTNTPIKPRCRFILTVRTVCVLYAGHLDSSSQFLSFKPERADAHG